LDKEKIVSHSVYEGLKKEGQNALKRDFVEMLKLLADWDKQIGEGRNLHVSFARLMEL